MAWILRGVVGVMLIGVTVCHGFAEDLRMSTLEIESVELRFVARVKPLSNEEVTTFFAEARKELPRLSANYSADPPEIGLWTPATKVEAAVKLLETIALEPRAEWEITIQVNVSRPGLSKRSASSREPSDKKQQEQTRVRDLASRLMPHDNATVGDALQALADTLGIGVAVMPKLVQAQDNDWSALLDLPLLSQAKQLEEGLTAQELIEHVAKRLAAAADFEEHFLVFNDPEDAKERRKLLHMGDETDHADAGASEDEEAQQSPEDVEGRKE